MTKRRPQVACGPAAPEELAPLGRILAEAFAFDPATCGAWFDAAGRDNVVVARRGGSVVGGLMVLPFGQYFGSRRVSCAGIAGVGVAIEARRTGVASALLRSTLRELHRGGSALSVLYASNPPLYRAAGYEPAGSRFTAKLDPARIPRARRRELTVERIGRAQMETVQRLYSAVAKDRPGHLDRNGYIWHRIQGGRAKPPATGLMLRGAGGPEGYLFYRPAGYAGDYHRALVTDLAATTPRALAQLWTTLADVATMVESFELQTAPWDPVLLQLDAHDIIHRCENWMLRIVDVAAALEQRGYPTALSSELSLEVADEVIDDNRGVFDVRIERGRAAVRRREGPDTGAANRLARVDIRAMAALYSGFSTPRELAARDLLVADDETVELLASAFGGASPWMRENF